MHRARHESGEAMKARPRVLIIEDDPATVDVLVDLFELEGFQTTATGSAIGAMDLLERTRPDAIVMDLVLPYGSGASFLSRLKANPDTAGIPVIICTAFSDTLTPERASVAAAVLDKPIDLRLLLAAVRKALPAVVAGAQSRNGAARSRSRGSK